MPRLPRVSAALGLAALSLLASAPAARAVEGPGPEVMTSVTPDRMASLLQEMGYRAEIQRNDEGKRRIRTRIGGANVTVFFYTCDRDEACTSIALRAYFDDEKKKGSAFANGWNRDKRFTKAYVDADNDANLELDILLRGGVTPKTLRAAFDIYEDHVKDFREALYD